MHLRAKYGDMNCTSLLTTFTLALVALLTSACSGPDDVRDTRFIMGTLVDFTVSDIDRRTAEAAVAAAAVEMQRIEDLFTIYGDQPNAVKAFNANPAGTPTRLPDEVVVVLKLALQVEQQSNGAFHPGLAKLNRLWGFSLDPSPLSPPAATTIRAALPAAGCIQQHEQLWLRSDENCQLDFGGIAKGYAIDRGIAVLRSHGINNAIINAGGDIRLIGSHHQQPWRIGIRDPRKAGGVSLKLYLKGDKSIVTSGDYERFFMYEGKRYHHILNPKTGWPAMANRSSTVMATSAMLADAWSTALFVGKPNTMPDNLQWMLVDQQGVTSGNLATLNKKP